MVERTVCACAILTKSSCMKQTLKWELLYTCSKTRLIENVFPLTSILKHKNVVELMKWRHFSRKCTHRHHYGPWSSLNSRGWTIWFEGNWASADILLYGQVGWRINFRDFVRTSFMNGRPLKGSKRNISAISKGFRRWVRITNPNPYLEVHLSFWRNVFYFRLCAIPFHNFAGLL